MNKSKLLWFFLEDFVPFCCPWISAILKWQFDPGGLVFRWIVHHPPHPSRLGCRTCDHRHPQYCGPVNCSMIPSNVLLAVENYKHFLTFSILFPCLFIQKTHKYSKQSENKVLQFFFSNGGRQVAAKKRMRINNVSWTNYSPLIIHLVG